MHEPRWVALAWVIMAVVVGGCTDGGARATPSPLDVPTEAPTPREPRERVIVAAGDIACAPGQARTSTSCHQEATAKLIARAGGDQLIGVLLLGDTQYETGSPAEYVSFDRSWGRAIEEAGVPVLPATGNHEYNDRSPAHAGCRLVDPEQHACGFERYFGDAAFTGDAVDGHGSFARLFGRNEPSPLTVVVLDVGRCERDRDACAQGGPVASFLSRVLADPSVNPPDACTVVAWHQARWSDYGHGDLGFVDAVWRALFEGGAATPDLVLNGHDHLYARMPPFDENGVRSNDGVTQVIAGASGRELVGIPFAGDPPGRTAFADPGRFGVLRLGWDPERGELSTVFVTEEGDRVDPQRFACR